MIMIIVTSLDHCHELLLWQSVVSVHGCVDRLVRCVQVSVSVRCVQLSVGINNWGVIEQRIIAVGGVNGDVSLCMYVYGSVHVYGSVRGSVW
jgi:hypothetical protein